MGRITKFLNPNAMTNNQIVEIAEKVLKEECLDEIKNIIKGVIDIELNRKDFQNTGDPSRYTEYMTAAQKSMDWDFERLQNRANYFSNAYSYDQRIISKSHPIVRLYILIISFNTCFKNYIWHEFEIVNAIYSGKREEAVIEEVKQLRNKAMYFSKHMDRMLTQILEISDSPQKVLDLQELRI